MIAHDGCKGCKYERQDEHLEPCLHCDGMNQGDKYARATNADRIRAMNDEELAEFLEAAENAGYKDSSITPKDETGFSMDMLEWLKSEVEE